MKHRPRISIITSTLNSAHYLPHLAESIRAQTNSDNEWIVIDGGSSDGTVDLLCSNSLGVTRWISEPDLGIYDAWNKGLELARGEWIGFLGADDCLLPDALETMIRHIEESREQPEFVCGRSTLMCAGNEIATVGSAWHWPTFRRYMCVAHTGALCHSDYFRRYGKFDVSYRISGDYELLLRAGAKLKAAFVNQALVQSQLGGVSNRNASVFLENLRAKRKHHVCGLLMGVTFMLGAWLMWELRRRFAR